MAGSQPSEGVERVDRCHMTSEVNTFLYAEIKNHICNKCYLVTAPKSSKANFRSNEIFHENSVFCSGCVFVIWEAFLSACAAFQHIAAV